MSTDGMPESLRKSLESTKVSYAQLGKSGLRVSVPILGAMSFGHKAWQPWVEDNEEKVFELLKAAYDSGVLMAERNDTNGDSHNNGTYAMYITASQPGPDHGPNTIKPGENLNPVKTLRLRYDAWRKAQPASFK